MLSKNAIGLKLLTQSGCELISRSEENAWFEN